LQVSNTNASVTSEQNPLGRREGSGGMIMDRLELYRIMSRSVEGRPYGDTWEEITCACRVCGSAVDATDARAEHIRHLVSEEECLQQLRTVGIIGFGSFGQLIARHLNDYYSVRVHDVVDRSLFASAIGVRWSSLPQVAATDVVVLAVPLSCMADVLSSIRRWIQPDALVVDVCSVKEEPLRLIRQHLPKANVVGMHPLFGPQSAKDGLCGHSIILCPEHCDHIRLQQIRHFLSRQLRLRVIDMSADAHDQHMAKVQALTHFISRALSTIGIDDSPVSTVAFEHLRQAVRLLSDDSWELFETIQSGNPYSHAVRRQFIEALTQIDNKVNRR
jgi:prephenate dehydrogenase